MNLAEQAILAEEKPAGAVMLSPAQRREIEIWFSQALDASSDRHRTYAKADELFRKCLTCDGGNVLVVTAYLENLARWRGRSSKLTWRGWRTRRKFKKALGGVTELYVLALEVFSREPDLQTLEFLAIACQELRWELAEEAYLREILKRDAGAAHAHARLAKICVGRADFHNALGHFEIANSHEPLPEVEECLDASKEPAVNRIPHEDAAVSATLENALALLTSNNFTAAENLLARAQTISGQNLAIREAREDLQLAQLKFHFAQLTALEEKGNTLAAKTRQSLYQKLTRLTLDIAGTRADRYPEDWQKRLALVRELIGVGNYYEVLRRLREPPAPPKGIESATAQKLLAETHQRLRQFDKALATYRELLQSESFATLSSEDQLKVRAQAERLADAMRAP